jgi:16S rRNA (uracil1498-N3)-methyltransferase
MKNLPRFIYASQNSESLLLDPDESKHALKSLRMKIGDSAILLNGYGDNYVGVLSEISKGNAVFKIIEPAIKTEKPSQLSIVIAPTKNMGRLEIFVEKATELGVKSIKPILTKHSERVHLNTSRLQRIAISAMKQSGRDAIPHIYELQALSQLSFSAADVKLLAHCRESEKNELKNFIDKSKSTLIMIGPEGDFSIDEVEDLIQKGFIPVSLGESRLRTETAALSVVAAYNLW